MRSRPVRRSPWRWWPAEPSIAWLRNAVLRAKFSQHPELADVLVATGDARIDYSVTSDYWSSGKTGRSWAGRLLELVGSEIVAQRSGMPDLPPQGS